MFGRIGRKIKKGMERFFLVDRGDVRLNNEIAGLFQQSGRFVYENRELTPEIVKIPVRSRAEFAWCGGQCYKGLIYGIPDGEGAGLVFDPTTQQDDRWGEFSDRAFKWTGGCIFEDKLYCFPRTEDHVLIYDLIEKKTDRIELGLGYEREHHYGGVMVDGVIYQPPRDTDHILAIDVIHRKAKKICFAPRWARLKLRYCGSVMHPNGSIYFLPERGNKVICFDPKTEEFTFIGDEIDCMCFDGQTALDGNIYGFSACARGILKIDVRAAQTEMIHTEIWPGSYGTKIGPNGKLYNIPGDGTIFWEYDPAMDGLQAIGRIESDERAKCAGGAVDEKGDIYCIPTHGRCLYKISFGCQKVIPEGSYDKIWSDCY